MKKSFTEFRVSITLVSKHISIVEVINMRTYYCKTNNLQCKDHRRRSEEHLYQEKEY